MATPSRDAKGINADPMFVNPNNDGKLDGFRLQAGSPAIFRGKPVANNGSRDFFGGPVSATGLPNIGVDNRQPSLKAVFNTNLSRVDLSWSPAPASGTVTYGLEWSGDGASRVTNQVGAATNWSDATVNRGRKYVYRVLVYTDGKYSTSYPVLLFKVPRK